MKKYTAKYFEKTKQIIEKHRKDEIITLQFFQRKDNVVLCGIEEVIKFLKKNTDTSKYSIKALEEGAIVDNKEVVLELEGNYQDFGIWEGLIDGVLSRMSSLATNAREIVKAANNKQVVCMSDRADHYLNQELDGYAFAIGGIETQVTDAQIELHNGKAIGTMPHALIQAFNGNLIEALKAYKDTFPNDKLTALVDFNNDVINDSLKALEVFGMDLQAIRIDTSPSMSDAFFKNNEEYGVTANLVKATRKMLDINNGKHVKIIVSSGFNIKKIEQFEREKAPVDIYGVGQSLLQINTTFSADAVMLNGKKMAKAGRNYNCNPKLKKVS